MVLELLEYLLVFAVSALFIGIYQRIYNNTRFVLHYSKGKKVLNSSVWFFWGGLSMLPLVAMFGLRYGIGTDYFSYEYIYEFIHAVSISDYIVKHFANIGEYRIELGYYILNYLSPSYRLLLWSIGILIFGLLLLAINDYPKEISFAFALFIYLSTQYIYSMNGMRFAVAVCFVLAAYNALICEKNRQFVLLILFAALFHKTAICCLMMLFLKQYKDKRINRARNWFLCIAIFFFPIISKISLDILRIIPIFERYFSAPMYVASETMDLRWTWILHVFFVIVPLLIVARKEIFVAENTSILFRIYMMEIPFRMLGLYNIWYIRLARYAQIALVLLLPLVIARVNNRHNKIILYVYYIVWFVFDFSYYAIVNDEGDSLPYVSIF